MTELRVTNRPITNIHTDWASSGLSLKALGLLVWIDANGPVTREYVEECFVESDGYGLKQALDEIESLSPIDLLSPPKKPKAKKAAPRKKSQHQIDLGLLEDKFAELTNIPKPSPRTGKERQTAAVRWWNPLRAILALCEGDVHAALNLMEEAVWQMRKDGLTIAAPASTEKVAIALRAKEAGDGLVF